MYRLVLFLFLSTISVADLLAQDVFLTRKGSVVFVSEAPLELITASSDELSGAIDLSNNRFAFKITNRSLQGFNSALQQEHFYENYMEVDKFRHSTFEGKIIEPLNTAIDEKQTVRAKGILSIHGIEKETIIQVQLWYHENVVYVSTKFDVLLEDYNIRIPSIVNQKIAETISIDVNAKLLPKEDD